MNNEYDIGDDPANAIAGDEYAVHWIYETEESGTDKDPYLSITFPVALKTLFTISSGKLTLKGSKLIIK
jgi:hypothetical protein